MKAAVLDATENGCQLVNVITNVLTQTGVSQAYFRLKDMNIMPCRSCGACGTRTPGRCVQKDDMPQLLRSMAASRLLVYITPVTFGGYSYQLKKAIDRTMPLGEPFYMVKNGHLLHPMRYGEKTLLAIGLYDGGRQEEIENFQLLVARNAMNMQSRYKTVIVSPNSGFDAMAKEMDAALREVV